MNNNFKMPSANDIWDWKVPSIQTDQPMKYMYKLLEGNLPSDFDEKLYKAERFTSGGFFENSLEKFLDGDECAPFLRIASTLVLLDKLAADPFFEEGDRRHVDREKVAMFFRILGGEIPLDSKTSSGSSFGAGSIDGFPSQARSVIDQCHIWAYIEQWPEMAFVWIAPKESVELLFIDLKSQVNSPVNTEELRQKLIRGEQGIDGFQQLLYGLYVKLGIVERVLHLASHVKDLEDKFAETRKCITNLCNELAVSTVGGLDDTTRSQIRAIPDKTTYHVGNAQFFDGWQDAWKTNLIQTFLKNLWGNYWAVIGIAIVGLFIDPDKKKREIGKEFIEKYAREMQVWVD